MKQRPFQLGVAALLAVLAGAAPNLGATDPTVSLTPNFVSQYVFRGERLGGPSFQPSLELDSGDWILGLWGNLPLADRVPGQSNPEIDPYASYSLTLNESLSVAPGFIWYTFPNADPGKGFYRSRFEPNLAVNVLAGAFRLTPKVYCDLNLKGPTYEFSAAVAVPLRDIGTELDWNAAVGTFLYREAVNGAAPAVKHWGDYFLVGVSAPFTISRNSKVVIGVAYTRGSGNFFKAGSAPKVANPAAVGRAVVSVSYSFTF